MCCGPEFTAKAVRQWLGCVGATTLYIEHGSPWKNCHYESFNGKLRDDLLERDIFFSLQEARILIERWRIRSDRRLSRVSASGAGNHRAQNGRTSLRYRRATAKSAVPKHRGSANIDCGIILALTE
jgi:hypothetical protein